MKMKLRMIVLTLATLIISSSFCTVVSATSGFGSQKFTVILNDVNDEPFEIWGYDGDGPMPAFRLCDIAYILNGTSAQFDIRASSDSRWDFWIKRGASYTATGAEMLPIPENRRALFGSYGFIHGYDSPGFDTAPIRNIILGVDGIYTPDEFISFRVVKDIDDVYFPLHDLGYLLGFSIERVLGYGGSRLVITMNPSIITPTPAHTPIAPLTNDAITNTVTVMVILLSIFAFIFYMRKHKFYINKS